MPPLRVLFVLDSHHLGGAELFLADLLEALDRERVEPAGLVCPPYEELDPLAERAERAGVPCRARLGIEGTWDFRGKRAFARLVRDFEGVLHFNLGSLDSCRHHLLALPGRGHSPPAVALLHSLNPAKAPGFLRLRRRRKALERLAGLGAVSRAVAQRASEYVPAEKIALTPNFLTPRSLQEARRLASEKGALRDRLGLPRDALVGICMGPLSPFKGQEILVDLLPRVRARFPGFLLVLAGGDKRGLGERLRARARAAGAEGALRLPGWTGEPLAWLAASDLLLVPGGPEGFPRVVMEAMAAGIPAVGFRYGGILDQVREGETGLLAEPGDREGFLAAWLRLLEDGGARARMGRLARAGAESFGPEKPLDALYRIYSEAFLTRRPAPPGRPGPSGP